MHPVSLWLLFFLSPYRARDVGKFRQDSGIFQPQFVIDGGRSANQCSGGNIVGHAALGRDDCAFSDFAVADDADLSGKNRLVADFRGASQADLCAQQGILADAGTVADLHQIVDFHAACDVGFADAGAVDARIGLHFHVVFNHHRCGLRNLVPASFRRFRESEPVGPDDHAVL